MTIEQQELRKLRALLGFNLLVRQATSRQTLTYKTFCMLLGLQYEDNDRAVCTKVLRDISELCTRLSIPLLSSLVVRDSGREKGLPGPGFWKLLQEVHESDEDYVRLPIAMKRSVHEELLDECFNGFDFDKIIELD